MGRCARGAPSSSCVSSSPAPLLAVANADAIVRSLAVGLGLDAGGPRSGPLPARMDARRHDPLRAPGRGRLDRGDRVSHGTRQPATPHGLSDLRASDPGPPPPEAFDPAAGRGVPLWLAATLNYCSRCGGALELGTLEGEDREATRLCRLWVHRLCQPAPRGDLPAGYGGRRGHADPPRHPAGPRPVGRSPAASWRSTRPWRRVSPASASRRRAS